MTFVLGLFSTVGGWFASALQWLSKNPGIMVACFVSLAFAMLLVSKNHEISGLRDQINNPKTGYVYRLQTIRDALTTERNNTASLKAGLDDANSALGQLQTKADDARVAYQRIIAGQAAGNARLDDKLKLIQSAKPGADVCASANALVRSAVQ